MRSICFVSLCFAAALVAGCSAKPKTEQPVTPASEPAPVYFKVDPATAGTITGRIRFTGKRLAPKVIDMSEEPAQALRHITARRMTSRWW